MPSAITGESRIRMTRTTSRFPRRAIMSSRYDSVVPAPPHGSSRIRTFLNSTGEPSDSRQRKPERGSHWDPPETSSPLTQSRISPLIPRT